MSIIARMVLSLAAGLIATMLTTGRRQQGLILTCVIGIVGAPPGGWTATRLFRIHSMQGFFSLSTWLTAIARRGHSAVRLPPDQRQVVQPPRLVRAPLTAAWGALRLSGSPRRRPAQA